MIKKAIIILLIFWAAIGLYYLAKEIYYSTKAGQDREKRKKEKHGADWEEKCAGQIARHIKVFVYRNLLVPAKIPLEKTECDMVFVNKKGIFCTECKFKSNVGMAACNINDEKCALSDTHGNTLEDDGSGNNRNPIYQNKRHIHWLKESLPVKDVPVFNFVYANYQIRINYMGKARTSDNISPINLLHSDEALFIGKADQLAQAIDLLPDVLSDEDIEIISQTLQFYTATDEEMKYFKEAQEKIYR